MHMPSRGEKSCPIQSCQGDRVWGCANIDMAEAIAHGDPIYALWHSQFMPLITVMDDMKSSSNSGMRFTMLPRQFVYWRCRMHVCTSETTSLTSSHRGASANLSRQRPQTLNGIFPTRLSHPAHHNFFDVLSLSLCSHSLSHS